MITPDALEKQMTLRVAVARYEHLRERDSLAGSDGLGDARPLSREEALELLALGEVIARKAGYGRQLAVRTARAAGASWSQIGQALGTSKQTAWEVHNRWLESQEQEATAPDPDNWPPL
ncbi:MAG: helix-turn-helix domain-containing protein [Frankia sp.]|nr:helix-turn-helix domain-containing protein [Frankia sp.]